MSTNGGVSVIITVWKRSYLEEQLKALVGQTIQPESIWIIQNERHIAIDDIVEKQALVFPHIFLIKSDFNFKFFGRFSLAPHVQTEYILIIDDDVIPAARWLEICLQKCRSYQSIISCTGRIIPPNNFTPEAISKEEQKRYFVGDNYDANENNYCEQDTLVDYGCNSYFFKTEWVRFFWNIWPCTFLSGEDIHLSASLKILQGISTIVPQQRNIYEYGNLKKYYSQDLNSSWMHNDFIGIRQKVIAYLINKNWQPIKWG